MGRTDRHDVVVTAGLTKTFRDFWLREKVTAVADLSMVVHPAEVFGLLGPNGSGKSTALKMILGLLFPTKGRISVFGKKPTDVRTKARIGFLPEESYLYPFLNAVETLDYYGQLFRQPRRQRLGRIDMLLEMVGLKSVAYRRIGEYSKGMQRRIGLAQALINDPDLLILDEPTSGMDPIGTRQFKDMIKMLAERGKSVLLSSHLLADVEDVCDRLCILYGGRQRAEGQIHDLLAQGRKTQITTDRLDRATLEQVRGVLTATGRDILTVEAPRDRLETLFLRIVNEAQAQRLVTGGALAGGQVAEFLRPQQSIGREVMDDLVSASVAQAEPAEAPAEQPAAPAESAPAADVVAELVEAPPEPEEIAPEAPTRPPARPDDQRDVDRGLIDDLLGGGKEP